MTKSEVLLHEGIRAGNKGNWSEACKKLKEAIKMDQYNSEAHYYIAAAYIEQGMWQNAREAAEEGLENIPHNEIWKARLLYLLGDALVMLKDDNNAIRVFEELLQYEERDSELSIEKIKKKLNLLKVSRGGDIREDTYKDPRYRHLIHEGFKKKTFCSPQIKQHLDKAEEYQSKKMYEEAIQEIKKAIQIYPKSAIAHNNLGAALANSGKYEEAENEFKLAIKLAPTDSDINGPYPDAEQNLMKLRVAHVNPSKLRVSFFIVLGTALAICFFSSLLGLKGDMRTAKIIASCGYLGAFVFGRALTSRPLSYFTVGASIWAIVTFLLNIIFRENIGGPLDAIIFSGINLFGFFAAFHAGARHQ